MKLFDVKNGNLREFSKVNFDEEYTEKILENWLEDSPDMILEDGRLLIIGRQVQTNFNSIIDLLGIDKEGNMVVIELKRNKTPRDTLAQALEYTSFVENLGIEQIEKIFQKYLSDETSSLPDYHRNYFKLGPEDAVSFNTNQRILIIGQDISREVRETSIFLRKKGIRITCLEFSYFKTNTDTDSHLMSFDIVVGDESSNIEEVTSVSLPKITKEKFINALDTVGKKIFARLFTMADEKSLLVKWGTKGFSLNVKKNNDQIPICQGYPPQSFYQQAIRITSEGKYGFLNKVSISESVMKPLFSEAQNSGLFQLAGNGLKLRIDDNLSEKDIQFVLDWIQKLANAIMDADDTVVEDESSSIEEVTSASLPKITKEKFVNALDTIGKNIFARLFAMADENALLVKWGTKGFSLNVKKNNDQIPICQGYPPQSSIYQQAIRITSEGKYGFLNKVPMSESVMKPLFSEAQNSGLFQLEGNGNGNGLKLRLDDNLSEKDIQFVLDWIQKLANAIIDADTVNP